MLQAFSFEESQSQFFRDRLIFKRPTLFSSTTANNRHGWFNRRQHLLIRKEQPFPLKSTAESLRTRYALSSVRGKLISTHLPIPGGIPIQK